MKKIALFVSGSGTNMENLIRRIRTEKIPCTVECVICDKPGAAAIEKAKKLGVEVVLISRKDHSSKEEFEAAILEKLEQKKVELLVLAGFMRILSADFVRCYPKKILNIHPSLLPAFPGAHGIRDAYEARVKETGVTVHWVVPEVDAGPVILQKTVVIEDCDTLESLEAKIHAAEYEIYPEALKLALRSTLKS